MTPRNASVAIIGAGDFIGSAIAERFAAEGYLIYAGRRTADKLQTLKDKIEAAGGRCIARGLDARGRMDGTPEVQTFASTLEKVCVDVVESGKMTKDLAILIRPDHPFQTTEQFMDTVNEELRRRMH